MLREKAVQVALANASVDSHLGTIQRLLDRSLHLLQYVEQNGMVDAEALRRRSSLGRGRLSYLSVKIPIADAPGKICAHPVSDEGMHHVQRRDAATAGDAITVENEAGLSWSKMRKGLDESRGVFPVNGKIPSLEQSRRR